MSVIWLLVELSQVEKWGYAQFWSFPAPSSAIGKLTELHCSQGAGDAPNRRGLGPVFRRRLEHPPSPAALKVM